MTSGASPQPKGTEASDTRGSGPCRFGPGVQGGGWHGCPQGTGAGCSEVPGREAPREAQVAGHHLRPFSSPAVPSLFHRAPGCAPGGGCLAALGPAGSRGAVGGALALGRSGDGAAINPNADRQLCRGHPGDRTPAGGAGSPPSGWVRKSQRPGRPGPRVVLVPSSRGSPWILQPGRRRPQNASAKLGACFGSWPRRSPGSLVTTLVPAGSRHPSPQVLSARRSLDVGGAVCGGAEERHLTPQPLKTGSSLKLGIAAPRGVRGRGAIGAPAGSELPQTILTPWSGCTRPAGRSEVGDPGPRGSVPWGRRGPGFLPRASETSCRSHRGPSVQAP